MILALLVLWKIHLWISFHAAKKATLKKKKKVKMHKTTTEVTEKSLFKPDPLVQKIHLCKINISENYLVLKFIMKDQGKHIFEFQIYTSKCAYL